MCQSVPDCVRFVRGCFSNQTTSLNTAPFLLTSLRSFYKTDGHSVCPRPKRLLPILRSPDSSGPVVFAIQNNRDPSKVVCQTRLAKRLQQGLQPESCTSSDRPPRSAPAIKLEPSIRLIQVLRTRKTPMTTSGIVITLAPPRMPSSLPVEFQPHSSTAWTLFSVECRILFFADHLRKGYSRCHIWSRHPMVLQVLHDGTLH